MDLGEHQLGGRFGRRGQHLGLLRRYLQHLPLLLRQEPLLLRRRHLLSPNRATNLRIKRISTKLVQETRKSPAERKEIEREPRSAFGSGISSQEGRGAKKIGSPKKNWISREVFDRSGEFDSAFRRRGLKGGEGIEQQELGCLYMERRSRFGVHVMRERGRVERIPILLTRGPFRSRFENLTRPPLVRSSHSLPTDSHV
ncbi:hypothetical protein GW17_00039231 [Ensete ventricosum]|nr:hypothetical protein GW17_00039231 [Ensete ventricosum]RZR79577.1 hypothetical protein BHM03_00005298 [Ensete ventricosum]